MKFLIPRSRVVSLLLLSSLSTSVPVLAQDAVQTGVLPQAAAPAQSGPVTAAPNYKLAAGDVLNVSVVDFPNLSVPQMVIAPDGTVSMPLVGQVSITGDTVAQATALMTQKWKKYVIDPNVTVSLVGMHQQTVVFSGAVNHPGVLGYRPGLHLIEALAEAGGLVTAGSSTTGSTTTVGLQTTISDASHVTVTHEDSTKQVLDLTNPETKAGTETDIALVPGDVVYVPQQLGKISISGEVREPGVIPFRENLTVFDAIADSGGFNPDTADLYNTKITHDGKQSTINLFPMMHNGDFSANAVLAPGDQISIPLLKNRTYVYGDVNRESYYFYKPGDRLLDALSGAGGPGPNADLSKINVIHVDSITKQPKLARVDLNDFLLRGQSTGNPVIQPGDYLYVPQKGHKISFSDIFQPIYAASSIQNIVR